MQLQNLFICELKIMWGLEIIQNKYCCFICQFENKRKFYIYYIIRRVHYIVTICSSLCSGHFKRCTSFRQKFWDIDLVLYMQITVSFNKFLCILSQHFLPIYSPSIKLNWKFTTTTI